MVSSGSSGGGGGGSGEKRKGRCRGASDPTFELFHSVWDELELLQRGVCSFHLPCWTLVLLEAAKDVPLSTHPCFTTELALSERTKARITPNNTY